MGAHKRTKKDKSFRVFISYFYDGYTSFIQGWGYGIVDHTGIITEETLKKWKSDIMNEQSYRQVVIINWKILDGNGKPIEGE